MKKYKNEDSTIFEVLKNSRKTKIELTYLEKINKIVDWNRIEKKIVPKIDKIRKRENAVGNSAYHPMKMLKVLLLQAWENLTDPQMETALRDRLSFMQFTQFGVFGDTPDHSTIARFRALIIKLKLDKKLFYEINKQLDKSGFFVRGKEVAVIDATIIESACRPRKQETVEDMAVDREEKDDDDNDNNKTNNKSNSKTPNNSSKVKVEKVYSVDKEAKWTKKGKNYYYGYKSHSITDGTGYFLNSAHITGANNSDIKEFAKVIEAGHIFCKTTILADKGYTSKKNRDYLVENNYYDGIMHKRTKNNPLTEEKKLINKAISKFRFVVEQSFGLLKKHFGIFRASYLGKRKLEYEFNIKATAFNLKKCLRYAEFPG